MNTVKFNKKNTLVIAHRGLSGIEKENTNAAFVAAGNRSYYGIETDVHITLDGKYVVFHDDTTGRVAVDNMEVEKTTFDCLRSLLLTDIDGVKGRSDIRIPTLQEYISICKKYEKIAVLELKNAFTEEQIYEIVDIIKAPQRFSLRCFFVHIHIIRKNKVQKKQMQNSEIESRHCLDKPEGVYMVYAEW